MNTILDLNEAARMLGKSPRQVMRYVGAGTLKATGGGRGVRFKFNKADVEAFKSQRIGVVDTELLARIAHGFSTKNIHQGLLMLWQWWKLGQENLIAGFIRNGLPQFKDVPQAVQKWARKMARQLKPAEMDYIAAMFIIRKWPLVKYALGENRALGVSLQKVKKAFVSWQQFQAFTQKEMLAEWSRIESLVMADISKTIKFPSNATRQEKQQVRNQALDGERRVFLDLKQREGAWVIFNRYPYLDTLQSTVLDAYWKGDRESLSNDIKTNFPEMQVDGKNPTLLLSAAYKQKKQAALRGKGSIRPARVAAVLGIKHRFQATRLWRGIKQKIGQGGVEKLANMLFLEPYELPKAWKVKASRKMKIGRPCKIDNRPVCPGCGEKVFETQTECSHCGRLL